MAETNTDIKTVSYSKGMNKDLNATYVDNQIVTHARNAILNTHLGDEELVFNAEGILLNAEGFKYSGIYTITNKVNGKIYVGSSNYLRKRLVNHLKQLRHNKHYNTHLQAAVNKYGIGNFKFESLVSCDIEDMFSIECYWINTLQTYNEIYGYNKDIPKPDGSKKCSKETIRIRTTPYAQRAWSEETRKEYSEYRKGKFFGDENTAKKAYNTRIKNNGGTFYKEGVKEEVSKRVTEYNKTRIFSQESRDKVSNTLKIRSLLKKGCTKDQAEMIIGKIFKANKRIRLSKKEKPISPLIRAYDIETQKEYYFNNLSECCRVLDIPRTTFYNTNKIFIKNKHIIRDEY